VELPIRDVTHWATGYGLPRTMLKLLARQGDPMARLLSIDSNPVDDIYPLIEQVRARGRMSRVPGAGWVCADAEILRELLRDSRIRTAKPSDRSPFRLGRWVLAKTDPGLMNPIEPPSMLVTDPPEHARLRQPVTRAFTPKALDQLRAGIQELANGLLDGLQGRTECDLVIEDSHGGDRRHDGHAPRRHALSAARCRDRDEPARQRRRLVERLSIRHEDPARIRGLRR
jgi:hypothetical protein